MGKKDIAVRKWLSDKGRFSDVCNAVLFGGKQGLHDMFRKNEDEGIGKTISKYIPDYHINLIDASNPENVYAFRTDL